MRLKSILFSAMGLILSASQIHAQEALYPNEFPLGDIHLLDGEFKHAQDLNVKVLLEYDMDRLLAPYLKEAGLQPKGESFSCWDGLDGHIGGHYLTALAIHYAATGNKELKDRIDYMISELKRCQDANGNGYCGGVPGGKQLWINIKNGDGTAVNKYWVPWYNVHKTYAGLRDAYVYAGVEEAKDMFLKMCDWGLDVISGLDDKQMEAMLATEFGGINEIFADAYQMTGDKRYLDGAKRFSHRWLFDSMLKGVDNLDNVHANTQVPKAVGYQRVAEVSGDGDYEKAARFFWHTVADDRSLSIGGNSHREHFAAKDNCISYVTDREGPESCNTNNMLKLTEGLFRMHPDAHLADFYERALYNHILSTQHPDHGGYVYFTSARPGHYRVYSQPNSAMWCCVGTGMENHGKYGQFIYTHNADSLYLNLFIPSRLDWKEKNLSLTQTTAFPDAGSSSLVINAKKPTKFALKVRYPSWAQDMAITVNGKNVKFDSKPGSYVTIDRKWKNGDKVEITMPMAMTLEELPNVPEYVSILHGPIVMGAVYNKENLNGLVADDSRWAHIANGPLVSVFDTPKLIGDRGNILTKLNSLKPESGSKLKYDATGLVTDAKNKIMLEPFYRLHDCRYMMYWLSMSQPDYDAYLTKVREQEEARLALDRRTIDAVNTGEQQPEADHFMTAENSFKGYHNDEPWRDARDGGWFAYKMRTGGKDNLKLVVRYWGNEGAAREFEIYADDMLVAKENLHGKFNKNEFMDVYYDIPNELNGKDYVTIKFKSLPGKVAGGVFHVRLIK